MAKALRRKPDWVPDVPSRIEKPFDPDVKLTKPEANDLDRQMHANYQMTQDAWRIFCVQLVRFRDGRGWEKVGKEGFKTFAGYLGYRYGIKQSRAYQLVDAADAFVRIAASNGLKSSTMVEKVSGAAEKRPILPDNERQIRPIAALRSHCAEAWRDALNIAQAEGETLTERHVRMAVAKFKPPKPKSEEPDVSPSDLRQAIEDAMELAKDLGYSGEIYNVLRQALEMIDE